MKKCNGRMFVNCVCMYVCMYDSMWTDDDKLVKNTLVNLVVYMYICIYIYIYISCKWQLLARLCMFHDEFALISDKRCDKMQWLLIEELYMLHDM